MKHRISSIMDMSKKKVGALVLCGALILTLGTGAVFAANASSPASQEPTESKAIEEFVERFGDVVGDVEGGRRFTVDRDGRATEWPEELEVISPSNADELDELIAALGWSDLHVIPFSGDIDELTLIDVDVLDDGSLNFNRISGMTLDERDELLDELSELLGREVIHWSEAQ